MALTFLRHHRKKALSKSPAAASVSPQTPSAATAKQDPSSTADSESLASEAPSVGEIPPRSPDEEQDSGICPDSGSDFSRQGSSDSSWTGKDGLEEEEEAERDSCDDCLRGAAVGEDRLDDQNFSTASCEDPSVGFVSGDVPDIVPESVLLYRNIDPEPEEPRSGPVDDSDFGSRDSLHEVQSPTVPPAPPPPGLDLRGDHTTSSTTDADGAREVDRLFGGRRRKVSRISEAETPPFTIERSTVDDYELRLPQGKATFYQARIGVAPEDTELGMMFRKRADRNRKQSDEEPEKDTRRVHRTDAKQENFSKSSPQNEASKLERVKNAKSPENVKAEANSADERTVKYHSPQKTEADDDDDDDTDRDNSVALSETAEDESLAADCNCIVQENGNTAYDESQRDTTAESGENEERFDAVVEGFDHRLQEEEEDNSPEVLLSAQSQHSISSPELSSSSFAISEAAADPVGPSSSYLPSPTSEEVFDYDLIASSAQTVEEHSKLLSQPLNSYNIIPDFAAEAADNAPPEMERRKSNRLSFRHLLQSLISPFGKANKVREAERSISAAAAETGQMAFDDNWSIHDTIRDKSGNDRKRRSLRDVSDNDEVRSLAETVDFNRNDGKDHSVRNWKDFMEKSGGGGGESPSSTVDPLTVAGKSDSGPSPTVLDAVTTVDIKPKVAGAEATPVPGRLSGKFRKSKSKTEMMEEIRSNRSSSSGLNSTLPSRRNHGMMQSLDSIFPASKLPMTTTGQNQQRHYQKRHETEPRKRAPAAAAKGSSALLSPVVRRRLRSLNGKK